MAGRFPKFADCLAKPSAGPASSPLGTYRGRCELSLIRHPGVPLYRRAWFLEHNLPAADYLRRGQLSGKELALAARLS
jgi:hypothetical protein